MLSDARWVGTLDKRQATPHPTLSPFEAERERGRRAIRVGSSTGKIFLMLPGGQPMGGRMNIEQVQKLNSAQVVTGVMKSSAHQPLWLGVPGIVEAVGTVESGAARISN